MSRREPIAYERLVLAAEAGLKAREEIAELTGGVRPYPAELMGSAVQPDCLADFTKYEMEEASEFLVRMGMIDKPATRSSPE